LRKFFAKPFFSKDDTEGSVYFRKSVHLDTMHYFKRIMVLILWLNLDSRLFYIEDLQASDADDRSQSIIADQAKVLKETLIKMTTKLLELIKTIR
jgi:hypothetical protein